MSDFEKRDIFTPVTADTNADGKPRIFGISPVFNQRSEVLYERGRKFVEVIRPGAIQKVIDGADVRGRFDHDVLLARTKNGTLKLEVREDGVHYEILVNEEDPQAMSAYAKVKRGEVDGSSFMFAVPEGGDEWKKENGMAVRYVNEFSDFLDVGPVAFPAYPQSSSQARSMADQLNDPNYLSSDLQPDPQDGQEPDPVAQDGTEDVQESIDMICLELTLLKLKFPKL